MDPKLKAAIESQRAAHASMTSAADELSELIGKDGVTDEQRTEKGAAFDAAKELYAARTKDVEQLEEIAKQRAAVPHDKPADDDPAGKREKQIEGGESRDVPYTPASRVSFFGDLVRVKEGDAEARERLIKNQRHVDDHVIRAVNNGAKDVSIWTRDRAAEAQLRAGFNQTASSGGEFQPPVWLQDFEPALRAGRAFWDACQVLPLVGETNSINVPKITSGATVAVQTADGNAVSNTDPVTTSVTAQVQTAAGRTLASYQSIDLGYSFNDQMLYEDLLGAYWPAIDTAALNGTVTNAKGVLNVPSINSVTFTNAGPTAALLYPNVFMGKSLIDKNAFTPVAASFWHPSTWNWYLSQLDSSSRPFALNTDLPAFNMIVQNNLASQGVAGNFNGIPVIVDANMPANLGGGTNQAPIVLANQRTLRGYESAPRFKVADQTSITTLQYQFVLYGYYAVAFGRQPKMISVINGTGMIVQAGF